MMKRFMLSLAVVAVFLSFPSLAEFERSEAAKSDFKYSHPCPSNGKTKGSCPGYVIDHIKALACGGADDPSNMQWQTVEQGKAKDAWERYGCLTGEAKPYPRISTSPSSGESYKGHEVITGPRGGKYYINSNGNKTYIKQ